MVEAAPGVKLTAETKIPLLWRPEGSINAELHKLPVRRSVTHDIAGKLFFLPRCRLAVIPTADKRPGWDVVVVHGSEMYPRGTVLHICNWELQRALELALDTYFGQMVEEAWGLT